jgi:hypothetical protein
MMVYFKTKNNLAGRCGVCGDNAALTNRPHETTATRKFRVTKTYDSGQVIDIKNRVISLLVFKFFFFIKLYFYLKISINYNGTIEVKVCPKINSTVEVKQECLDANLLEILPNARSIPNDKYRLRLFNNDSVFTFKYTLFDLIKYIYL